MSAVDASATAFGSALDLAAPTPTTGDHDVEPRRWLAENDGSFRAALLRSADLDAAPPPRAAQRLKEKVAKEPEPRMMSSHLFDSVLGKSTKSSGLLRSGAAFSVGCHVAIVGLVVLASTRAPSLLAPPVANVTFFDVKAAQPPPPPAAAAAAAPEEQRARTSARRTTALAEPSHAPVAEPAPSVASNEAASRDDAPETARGASSDGIAGGVPGGAPGGVTGGTLEGVLDAPQGAPKFEAIPFGPGMTRPTLLSGPRPDYTREARQANVEGRMLVRCVVTTEGRVTDCRVIKGLPFMEDAVLGALAQQRYAPATFQGRAVAINYIFSFAFKLR